jgi:hypothetical protein
MIGMITPAAIAEYTSAQNGGEMYAVLSKEAIHRATGKAPNGFDFDQLDADLTSLQADAPAAVPQSPATDTGATRIEERVM